MGHLVDRKTDGEQRPRPVCFRVGLVLLYNGHDHVTLVARRPGYAYVKLRIHGRRFRMSWPATSIISAPPPPPGQHGPPRLLRVQRWFGHPVVRAHVHDVQLREVSGKILERHPVNAQPETQCQYFFYVDKAEDKMTKMYPDKITKVLSII